MSRLPAHPVNHGTLGTAGVLPLHVLQHIRGSTNLEPGSIGREYLSALTWYSGQAQSGRSLTRGTAAARAVRRLTKVHQGVEVFNSFYKSVGCAFVHPYAVLREGGGPGRRESQSVLGVGRGVTPSTCTLKSWLG